MAAKPKTTQLRLASGDGPVTRTVLLTPPRDALPSEIPVIDISPMFSDSLADRQAVARKIRDAATNTGFFYVANHGVPSEVTDDAYTACLDFFRQDTDTKMKAHAGKSVSGSGYRGLYSQRVNPDDGLDPREYLSFKYEPKLDPAVSKSEEIPEDVAKHFFSNDSAWEATAHLPGFKEAMVRYFKELLVLGRALTRAFALSLDLAEDAFDAKVQYPNTSLALAYYPVVKVESGEAGKEQESNTLFGAHTDFQLFTMLWQASNGGLQVLKRDGQWIKARPMAKTLVVNMGDFMQRITNDRYVSTVHRVRNDSGRERVSIPFFWGFGAHDSCGVLDSCVGPGETKKYEEIGCEDWLRRRLAGMLMQDAKAAAT